MPDRNEKQQASFLRYAGIGMELVGAVAGFALVGYWIDRHYDTSPWGVLMATVLGLVGGLYNLIRSALAAFSNQQGQQNFSTDSKPERFEDEGDPER